MDALMIFVQIDMWILEAIVIGAFIYLIVLILQRP